MNYNEFLDIIKTQAGGNKMMHLKRVKRDYYIGFLNASIKYNLNHPKNKIQISSTDYDTYFDSAIDNGDLIKSCCGYYKLNY